MRDPLRKLNPAVRRWFGSKFTSLTDIQRKALTHTLPGRSTLILAPTGSGKTLSAFLSCLSRLADSAAAGTLPNAVRVVYVSPLKSLDRDIHRNLTEPLEAINAQFAEASRIRMEVRTGDTQPLERSRQQ